MHGRPPSRVRPDGRYLWEPGHAIRLPTDADGSSVFKEGRTAQARFRVCDARGRSVGAPGVVTSFRLVQSTVEGAVAGAQGIAARQPPGYHRALAVPLASGDRLGHDVTALLVAWRKGDGTALDRLIPLVYDELREQARRQLRRERPHHTLQPTALVHEAFLRLVPQDQAQWLNREQFFAVAGRVMRRVLVDHARARAAAKRGQGLTRVTLEDAPEPAAAAVDVLALDEALGRLAARDERLARVVDLRYFGGLSLDETASVLDVSLATVKRDWTMARAWLFRELGGGR